MSDHKVVRILLNNQRRTHLSIPIRAIDQAIAIVSQSSGSLHLALENQDPPYEGTVEMALFEGLANMKRAISELESFKEDVSKLD